MKLNITAGIIAILLLVSMHSASATSFIVDCQYDDYRTNNSDLVFTGTVTEIDYNRQSTDITLQVRESEKGEVNETVVLTQPGNIKTGSHMIPSLTLEWTQGDVYRIQATYQREFESDEISLQLTCGEMGRELISLAEEPAQEAWDCRDIASVAINPHTQEREEFISECDVPRGWTLVTRTAQPEITCSTESVIAVSNNGVRQNFESDCDVPRGWAIMTKTQTEEGEMCAQVITYAQDPQTGDIHQYPTPCDVPEGWNVVDEPQEAEQEITPKPSFWNTITTWLRNLF